MHRHRAIASALTVLAILVPTINPVVAYHAAATDNTVTIGEPSAPDTLNPLLTRTAAGADAAAPLFDSLVRIDSHGVFQADLASRWHRSVDARSWTFFLNPHAYWHDGEPITAKDIAFTIGLVRDARFGASSTLGFDHITSVIVDDAHTITIKLQAAYAPFLATVGGTSILPAHVLDVLSPDQIRSYTSFNRRPIGSGPFTVAEVSSDGRVIEEANRNYFLTTPYVDRLVFTPMTARKVALSFARTGKGALLPPSFGFTTRDLQSLGGAGASKLRYTPSFSWTHIDLIAHGAFTNPLVRQALALATPRGKILARVLHGHGRLSDSDQAPGTPAFDPTIYNTYPYNPSRAEKLLRRVGFTTVKKMFVSAEHVPFVVNLWADESCPSCADAARIVQQSWRAAGVETHLRLVPTTTLFGATGPLYSPTRFQTPDYNAVLYTWVNGPDPNDSSYWARRSLVTEKNPLGGNFVGYSNPLVDTLMTRALVTPTGPSRYALYHRIQHILTHDEPVIFLYWADTLSIVPATLHGYAPNPYQSTATWNTDRWLLSK